MADIPFDPKMEQLGYEKPKKSKLNVTMHISNTSDLFKEIFNKVQVAAAKKLEEDIMQDSEKHEQFAAIAQVIPHLFPLLHRLSKLAPETDLEVMKFWSYLNETAKRYGIPLQQYKPVIKLSTNETGTISTAFFHLLKAGKEEEARKLAEELEVLLNKNYTLKEFYFILEKYVIIT